MVFLTLLRTAAYFIYGAYQRRRMLGTNPQAVIEPMKKHYTCVYAGIRMADIFGHVNNSKYLEICELARWHYGGYIGMVKILWELRASFVVASVNVQYVREILPCRRYLVTTEVLRFEDAGSSSDKPISGKDESGVARNLPPAGRMVIMHEIWSMDKKTLYAGILLRAALVGDAKSPLAIPSGGKRRGRYALLDCRAVYAAIRGADGANELANENMRNFYNRLGFQPNQEDFNGDPWIEASMRLEKEWRSKLQSVKEP
ncbi:hypothetical protein TcYC6_0012250 [Trypanosoma cruzi]|nr:hypothetical protein TcYC6_0012250 [Trypanosoma cruzi]